jgi:hypothetical protein
MSGTKLADIHEITFALACKYNNGDVSLDSSSMDVMNVIVTDRDGNTISDSEEGLIIHVNDKLTFYKNNNKLREEAILKFNQAKKSAEDLIEHLKNPLGAVGVDNSWKSELEDDFFKQPLQIVDAYWTNTGKRFTDATRKPHNNNPSDVVVAVTPSGPGGTDKKYLGVSLKATKGKTDIGMYNGGLSAFVAIVSHGQDLKKKPDSFAQIPKVFDTIFTKPLTPVPGLEEQSSAYLKVLKTAYFQAPTSKMDQALVKMIDDELTELSKKFTWKGFSDNAYKKFFKVFYKHFIGDTRIPVLPHPPPPSTLPFTAEDFDKLKPDQKLQVLFYCYEVSDKTIKNAYQNYVKQYLRIEETKPVNFKKLLWKYLVPNSKDNGADDPFNKEKKAPRSAPFSDTEFNFNNMKLITFNLLRNKLFDDFATALYEQSDKRIHISQSIADERWIELSVANEFLKKVLGGMHQQTHDEINGETSVILVPYVKVTSIVNKGNKTLFKIPVLKDFLANDGSPFTNVKLEISGHCSLILSTNDVKRFIIRVKCESVPPSSIKIDIKPCSGSKQGGGGLKGGALVNDVKDIDIDIYIKYLSASTGNVDVDNHCAEITQDIIKEIEQTLPYYETRSVTKLYADIIELKTQLNERKIGNFVGQPYGTMIDLITEYFYRVQDEDEEEDEELNNYIIWLTAGLSSDKEEQERDDNAKILDKYNELNKRLFNLSLKMIEMIEEKGEKITSEDTNLITILQNRIKNSGLDVDEIDDHITYLIHEYLKQIKEEEELEELEALSSRVTGEAMETSGQAQSGRKHAAEELTPDVGDDGGMPPNEQPDIEKGEERSKKLQKQSSGGGGGKTRKRRNSVKKRKHKKKKQSSKKKQKGKKPRTRKNN